MTANSHAPPAGYVQVLYWSISENRARLIAMQVLGVALFVPAALLFLGLAASVGRAPQAFELGPYQCFLVTAGMAATFVLHELAHGAAMRLSGARPEFGVLPTQLMFYATSPGFSFPRAQYVAITLAPLVGLSMLASCGILLLAGSQWVVLLALCAAVNASGAIGDLWILAVVLRYPAQAYVQDERDGVRIWLPADR